MFGGMPGGMGGGMGGGMPGGPMGGGARGGGAPPPVEFTYACTLEEIYTGTTKKFNVGRKLLNGCFGVVEGKWTESGEVLRLIINLIPMNMLFETLIGDIRTLPYGGQLSGITLLDEDTVAVNVSLFSLSGERLQVGPFPPGSKVEVTLLPGAISGPGGSQADTLDGRFSVRRDSDFGAIILDVDSTLAEQEGVLWMLLNGSGQPARDQGLDGDFGFERLLPGKYGVVCIADADGNGRWSGADPERGLMPEEVLHRTEGVDVRAGWEVELQITVHPRP